MVSIEECGKRLDRLKALKTVTRAANQFSPTFFKYVVDENPGNLITSSLSAALVLALVGYGARGKTEKQFKEVLHVPGLDSAIYDGYQILVDTISNALDHDVYLANKVFISDKYPVKSTYNELSETYFRSAPISLDFSKNEEAAEKINGWVAVKTACRIEDMISPNDVNEETTMVLVNTICFRAEWQDRFKIQSTAYKPFHIHEFSAMNVLMMYRRGVYRHGDIPELNARYIELPCKNGVLSMVVIVPNEIEGLPELTAKLQDITILNILRRGYTEEVELYIPKIKLNMEIQLNNVLHNMGLVNAFEDRAEFPGITESWSKLKISKIVQKLTINVNEYGIDIPVPADIPFAEFSTMQDANYHFKVDRPSYYAIFHTGSQVALLSGLITNPYYYFS